MGEAVPCGEAGALGTQARPPPLPPAGPDGGGGRGVGSLLLSSPTKGLCRGLDFFPHRRHMGRSLTHTDLGQHINPVESHLKRYRT